MACACQKIGKMARRKKVGALKDIDYMDAAITTVGVVGGNVAANPVKDFLFQQAQNFFPNWDGKTVSYLVNGIVVVFGFATPAIIAMVSKDKTLQKLAVAAGIGMISNAGTSLAKEAGVISGYGGMKVIKGRLGASPQNKVEVAGRKVGGSPQNKVQVASKEKQYFKPL